MTYHRIFSLLFLVLLSQLAYAQSVPPEQIGLSTDGLDKITAYLREECEQGHIPGAVAAISRHGRIGYWQAVGKSDLQTGSAMRQDALFRIASMTKAVTSAAVMSLVEDGVLSLDDPVSKHLPEFENKGREQPTIHDLLTHRSGLTYGWFGPESLDSIYRENDINNLFEPTDETIGDRVKRIAKLPLKFNPGTAWDYSVSTDVLGRVVEVASGLTLDHFFRERFFRPLQMNDTFFYVPENKQSRLASLYTIDESQQLAPVGSTPIQKAFFRFSANYCTTPGKFFSGGGGLVSSTGDYLRFLHMLLGGGELDGVRVLQHETVAMMTQNQIGDMTIYLPGHGDGFGFGFGVVTDHGAEIDEFSAGSFSWGGIFNTYFWVDPQEKLVGILMTQLFPNDHLSIRDEFRKLAYAAINDSGFEKLYRYQPGDEYANPHFNARQLRVNAPDVSTHPEFASRSEPRSSGLARIRVDEDLRKIRRADLELELWGGHPGTLNKRVTINGRSTYVFPEVGTATHHCTHQYPSFNLRPTDLVNGYNSLQFACDTGETFWGHYIVDRATLCIGLSNEDQRLTEAELQGFEATVSAEPIQNGEGFQLRLETPSGFHDRVARVIYEARYLGYDENGDLKRNGWHRPIGTTTADQNSGLSLPQSEQESPDTCGRATFSTRVLPAQKRVQFRAMVEFKNTDDLRYRTPVTCDHEIAERNNESVQLYSSHDLPRPFWSRNNKVKECTINVDLDPINITDAELHVVAWTGGAGEVRDYFTLNGKHIAVAEGSEHETVYSRIKIDPKSLRRGKNRIILRSDTKHHGIEIMRPGPAIMIRHNRVKQSSSTVSVLTSSPAAKTVLLQSAKYKSLDCYRVETPIATYYLDKVGAGLASMIDRDGNDWLSFDPKKGTGAAGEYRGFPNAVFQEAGNYFHARNAGTDPCVTKIEEQTADRVVISASSDNGKWAGRYTFTPSECVFTMTKKPEGHRYWVLYEGTPGGQYDDDDWWMTSRDRIKLPMTQPHNDDLPGTQESGEWIAFGDDKSSQMLVLRHFKDDPHPDRFYEMEKKMTVFGFGRAGMKKYLNTVPQSFSIGFQNISATPAERESSTSAPTGNVLQSTATDDSLLDDRRKKQLAQLALTQKGDAKAGAKLFHDQRTKCSTCHRVGKDGGQVGPDLSNIGGKLDRPHLIDSLLYPSQQIGYGYETTIVVTEDGKTFSGIARESTDTHVTLLDSANKSIHIAKANIEQTKISQTSIMPSGLEKSLDESEFVNLVAYLETLGHGKGKFGSGVSGPIKLANGFELTTIATGLSGAVAMEVAPDGRIFICEQGGTLKMSRTTFRNAKGPGQSNRTTLVDSLTIPVELNWERGLIGVTVAPGFPSDPHLYVVYVTDKPYTHHRVSRFTITGDIVDPGSEVILLKGDDQSQFGGNVPAGHQGGGIHFGPDGKLYVGLGEQTAGKPSQQMNALQGKILRLNADGSIPSDNPFLNETSDKYQTIWAKGCRNPFTFAFNTSGDMFINDVGGKFEEINLGIAGANYGWPGVNHGPTDRHGITGPIHIYPQSCINGGDFCESGTWPNEYQGKYFFADFNQGWVKYLDPESPKKSYDFLSGIRRPVDLRFGPNGSLYVLLRNAWVVDDKFQGGTGALLRISPSK